MTDEKPIQEPELTPEEIYAKQQQVLLLEAMKLAKERVEEIDSETRKKIAEQVVIKRFMLIKGYRNFSELVDKLERLPFTRDGYRAIPAMDLLYFLEWREELGQYILQRHSALTAEQAGNGFMLKENAEKFLNAENIKRQVATTGKV